MGGFQSSFQLLRDAVGMLFGREGALMWTWFLAGVFAISGTVKLRSPDGAALAMVQFGMLKRVRPLLGTMLGLLEVTLAALLAGCAAGLGTLLPWVTGVTAALLFGFAFLIGRSLLAGQRFPCFCFGDAESQLSGWTLGRTVILALVAAAVTGRAFSDAVSVALPGDRITALSGVSGLALLGSIALLSRVPALLQWNRNLPPPVHTERSTSA